MSKEEPRHAAKLRFTNAMKAIDSRASLILTCHAVVERELDLSFEAKLPNPKFLRRLGFGHKTSVLAAMFPATEERTNKIIAPMLRLNDLRNSFAHGDGKKQVDAALNKLLASMPGKNRSETDESRLEYAVGYITGALHVFQQTDGEQPA